MEIEFYKHNIGNKEKKRVLECLDGIFLTTGAYVSEFEKKFARYFNVPYAVGLTSCTAALHLSLLALGVSEGDEVITTPMTFIATANAILYTGAHPVFVDVEHNTGNIDTKLVQSAVADLSNHGVNAKRWLPRSGRQKSGKIKAILPVHVYGQPADMDPILEVAEEFGLKVIEDACEAVASEYKGRKVGTLGDYSVFAFYPNKQITTGEGGMVLTNDAECYEKLQMFRTHGITKDSKKLQKNEGAWYYEMQTLGYNYRITDFQCALGISQLKKIDNFIKKRRSIASKYNEAFIDIEEIVTPFEKKDVKSTYHLYIIQLNLERLKISRKTIFDALRAENIGVHVHYIPVHLQPYYREKFGHKKGDFPIAEKYYERAITLPLFPKMNDNDVKDVINAVKKVIDYYRK